MKLDSLYTPESLLDLEINTLNLLQRELVQYEGWNEISSACSQAISSFKARKKVNSNWIAEFESKCTISSSANDRKNNDKFVIYFGGRIQAKTLRSFECISYFLAVSRKDGNGTAPKVLRKFHFDYDPSGREGFQKPIFHLQYGGELTPKMITDDCSEENQNLNSWLSIPRVYFYPMSLCLLLNILFWEFTNSDTHKIINESWWANCVKQNEDYLFKPFFQEMGKSWPTSFMHSIYTNAKS